MSDQLKTFVVTLKKDIDYNSFYYDMENLTKKSTVPDRIVDFANELPYNARNTHYLLTDEEADQLRQDSRVLAVEIPPEQRDDVKIELSIVSKSNFTKTSSSSGSFVNWGLLRCAHATNVYNTGTSTTALYSYHLDGTGVDIVIHDSGLQIDHPEFTDELGNSRVETINWYTASGITGTQSPNHNRDFDGHGTHVAGIAAGKNYGWAKNSKIYSLKVNGLEGSGDSGTGISITDCFDVVRLWHRNKPVDPSTGLKRPTIVNMSWGYSYSSNVTVTGGNYRGTNWTFGSGLATTRAACYSNFGLGTGNNNAWSARIPSVDADLDELISEGVIVCVAAGNNYDKADLSTGADYNNYVQTTGGTIYYHRGSSPHSVNAVRVGCISNSTVNTSTSTERTASFSTRGPYITVWAPGSAIQSTTSNTNTKGGVSYFLNSSYKQLNISGTSMASPQIAGIGALYVQLNPGATPAEFNDFLIKNSKSTLYTSGSDIDYTNTTSLLGAPNRYVFWPFAADQGIIPTNIEVTATFKK
jgi:subtilisin family serine protease